MSDKKVPTFSDYLHQKNDRVYFNSFTDAVSYVYDIVSKKFTIDEDDWFNQIAVGGKPKKGQTKKGIIGLIDKKTKKPFKKSLAVQVYNRGTRTNEFELNWYIN